MVSVASALGRLCLGRPAAPLRPRASFPLRRNLPAAMKHAARNSSRWQSAAPSANRRIAERLRSPPGAASPLRWHAADWRKERANLPVPAPAARRSPARVRRCAAATGRKKTARPPPLRKTIKNCGSRRCACRRVPMRRACGSNPFARSGSWCRALSRTHRVASPLTEIENQKRGIKRRSLPAVSPLTGGAWIGL